MIKRGDIDDVPSITYVQGLVAANLYFDELVQIVVPMTEWWHSRRVQEELKAYADPDNRSLKLNRTINTLLGIQNNQNAPSEQVGRERFSALDRYMVLTALLLWAKKADPAGDSFDDTLKGATTDAVAGSLDELFKILPKYSY